MVLAVKKRSLDLLLRHAETGGINVSETIFEALYLFDALLHLLFIAIAASAHAVQHQPRILAHLYRFSAQGDHAGHAGRDTVHIDVYVRLAVFDGVVDGDAAIHIAAVTVDADMDPAPRLFGFQQFPGHPSALYFVIVSDVTVKEDGAHSLRIGLYIEKSAHICLVLAHNHAGFTSQKCDKSTAYENCIFTV